MDVSNPPPPRGRPRDPTKREALIDGARSLFIDYGLDAVTMDQIVAASGVSRATLYGNFADKGALVEAVFARESERIVSDAWAADIAAVSLKDALTAFGMRLLSFLTHPEMLGLERLSITAARAYPELAARFYQVGPGRARIILMQLVQRGQAEGLLRPGDPAEAVADLTGLWQGFLRVELCFGARAFPSEAELRRHAEHGVAQFLRLYSVEL